MMGQQPQTESLFYYFRLQDQVPEDHLLRLIHRHVDFSFVREQLKDFYSPKGRPSIDPEVLLRLLLVGISMESPASGAYWKKYACIWPIVGSLGWGLKKRFRTTPRSPRTGTADSGSAVYFEKYLRGSCGAVCRPAW